MLHSTSRTSPLVFLCVFLFVGDGFQSFLRSNKRTSMMETIHLLDELLEKKGAGLCASLWRGELASVERSLVSAITAFGGARTQSL